MTNSRRGFLASLLALLPLARSASATTIVNKLSTIRIVNNASLPGRAAVAPALISQIQYRTINAGASLDFAGIPGLATGVGALDFLTGKILLATITTFPPKGTVVTYYLNFDGTTTTLTTTPPTSTTALR